MKNLFLLVMFFFFLCFCFLSCEILSTDEISLIDNRIALESVKEPKQIDLWLEKSGLKTIYNSCMDFNSDKLSDIAFYRPGSAWGSLPVLLAQGNGSWSDANPGVPSWANQPGVVAIPGDFNSDGRTDVAFHRPGGPWGSLPVLLAQGNGSWSDANPGVPSWANQPGVVAIPGDYNSDGRTDIAFHRPGGPWQTLPILFAQGDGSWSSSNHGVPAWANQPAAVAIPGDFNSDGRTDIAFHRPGGVWQTVPVLFAQGDGSWSSSNHGVPAWANQPGAIAIPGDYNSDGRTDIAFHRPGGPWQTLPVLFAQGNGSWDSANYATPDWPNQPAAVAIPGDYNSDGRTDIAFHRPGGPWQTLPVLFAQGDGSWSSTNYPVPAWANQPGAIAIK